MPNSNTISLPLLKEPGINRDSTDFDTNQYIDGYNVRFVRGRPQKIGGHLQLSDNGTTKVVNCLSSYTYNTEYKEGESSTYIYLYAGSPDGVNRSNILIDSTQIPRCLDIDSITPTLFFKANNNNLWSFDQSYSLFSNDQNKIVPINVLFAQVNLTLNNYNNMNEGYIYFYDMDQKPGSPNVLYPLTSDGFKNFSISKKPEQNKIIRSSNGFLIIGSAMMCYGRNGYVYWSTNDGHFVFPSEDPEAGITSYSVIVGSENFIFGAPIRSGQGLSALLWSTGKLVLMTAYLTENNDISFNSSFVSTEITCLSPRSIVSYEPLFFWVGTNSFYVYNGSVTTVENNQNKDFFFNNLNTRYSAKVTSFINRKYNEWWVLFPKGDSVENNHAIVYMINEQKWYDTPINVAVALKETVDIPYPIMSSTKKLTQNGASSSLYVHEFGWDSIEYDDDGEPARFPIAASITQRISLRQNQPYSKQALFLDKVTLDIKRNLFDKSAKSKFPSLTDNDIPTMKMIVTPKGYPGQLSQNESYRSSQVIKAKGSTSSTYEFLPTDYFITTTTKGTILDIEFKVDQTGDNFLFGQSIADIRVLSEEDEGPVVDSVIDIE